MKTINVYVEKAKDGTYWGSTTNTPGVVSAFGNSLEELKKNFEEAFEDHIEVAKELNEDWVGEYSTPIFEYQMDLQGFFSLVSAVTIKGIAQRSNISHAMMRQYATGKATVSEERLKVIQTAVHDLGKDLQTVSF